MANSCCSTSTATLPAGGTTQPAVELAGVNVGRGKQSILANITANIPKQSITAIIGPNGAGKTTLLHAILGLCAYQGRISFTAANGRRPRLGFVPQRLDFDRATPIRVIDFLSMAWQRWPVWFGISKTHRDRAEAALKRVEAHHLADRLLGALSGGELQRVQLALALLNQPDILLLDEPVSGVDLKGGILFCDLLQHLRDTEGLTMVMVSHDLSVVSQHATYVLCLNRKLICAGPVTDVMNHETLAEIYGPHTSVLHHHHQSHGPAAHPQALLAGTAGDSASEQQEKAASAPTIAVIHHHDGCCEHSDKPATDPPDAKPST